VSDAETVKNQITLIVRTAFQETATIPSHKLFVRILVKQIFQKTSYTGRILIRCHTAVISYLWCYC